LAARTKKLVLDPVYSGKAMADLIATHRSGELAGDQPVVFVHTGGLPALFAGRWPAWVTGG
jgi:D-cysteine desulfhydrase